MEDIAKIRLDKFGDKFVNEIEWSPLSSNSATFQTHKLKKISDVKY